MSKQPVGLAYIGNSINYPLYLPDPFPRGPVIDLDWSNTFLLLMLLMHIDKLGLYSHLYGSLLNCLSICLGSWAGAKALCMEVGWLHCSCVNLV